MSYSFRVKAADKLSLMGVVQLKLDEVVKYCPEHAKDRNQIFGAIQGMVVVLENDTTRDIEVDANGGISFNEAGIQQAEVRVSASLVTRA